MTDRTETVFSLNNRTKQAGTITNYYRFPGNLRQLDLFILKIKYIWYSLESLLDAIQFYLYKPNAGDDSE